MIKIDIHLLRQNKSVVCIFMQCGVLLGLITEYKKEMILRYCYESDFIVKHE